MFAEAILKKFLRIRIFCERADDVPSAAEDISYDLLS